MAIKFSKVIDRIRELAKNDPYRTAACSYFNASNNPVCIVGHVLHEMVGAGFIYPEGLADESSTIYLADSAGNTICPGNTTASSLPWPDLGFRKPTPKQLAWVSEVQAQQDMYATWAEAVALADGEVC